jgi:cytochrome bd ubiquinol oxidase subunit II
VSTLVAVILFGGVLMYGVFGGADFGAGFWDLTAGGLERGRGPRHLIDESIGPVWEANHTWLIFCLVVMWTAFSSTFAAIMTTLYLPLGLAAFGIVLRGSGFAFRKVAVRTAEQRLSGAAFAISSVVTPFCFGAVAGAVASGRVPAKGNGDAFSSWLNPTSITGGLLAVTVCAYLAAVFLTVDARLRAQPDLEQWARRRAVGAAAFAGVVSIAGLFVLRSDAHRLYRHLLHQGLAFVIVSVLAGLAALLALRRADPRLVRILAVAAVGAVLLGWGTAQYPYLLGTHTSIAEAAAPHPTLASLTVIAVAAVVLVVPSIVLLFVLQQRGRLESSAQR